MMSPAAGPREYGEDEDHPAAGLGDVADAGVGADRQQHQADEDHAGGNEPIA